MKKMNKDIMIREASVEDAKVVCDWWNDGQVMAHAGYPNGLGTTVENVAASISAGTEEKGRILIIQYKDKPIGELSYHRIDEKTAEIGIKICNQSMQNKGYGKVIMQLYIDYLFQDLGFQRIILDTNLKNERAQHFYEKLGFKKVRVNEKAYKNQLGEYQTSVDYELVK